MNPFSCLTSLLKPYTNYICMVLIKDNFNLFITFPLRVTSWEMNHFFKKIFFVM